jgi:hypothetical protein
MLLTALLFTLLLAQSSLIEVEASVDKSVITIGDLLVRKDCESGSPARAPIWECLKSRITLSMIP